MKKQWNIYDKLYMVLVAVVSILYYITEITDSTGIDNLIGK